MQKFAPRDESDAFAVVNWGMTEVGGLLVGGLFFSQVEKAGESRKATLARRHAQDLTLGDQDGPTGDWPERVAGDLASRLGRATSGEGVPGSI